MAYPELRPNQFGTTVGLWHLNGNSTDSSGNGNNGTDTAITYSQANGKFGQGAGFNGTTSSISVAAAAAISLSAHYTVSCWFNATSLPSSANSANLIGTYHTTPASGYEIRLQNFTGSTGQIRSLHGVSGYPQINANVTIVTGTWYHLSATFNGTVMKVYLNGAEVGTFTTSTASANSGYPLVFGSLMGTQRFFSGKMDEICISSTALTANQIRQLYAYQKGLLGRYA